MTKLEFLIVHLARNLLHLLSDFFADERLATDGEDGHFQLHFSSFLVLLDVQFRRSI